MFFNHHSKQNKAILYKFKKKKKRIGLNLGTGYQRKIIIHTLLYPLHGKCEEDTV